MLRAQQISQLRKNDNAEIGSCGPRFRPSANLDGRQHLPLDQLTFRGREWGASKTTWHCGPEDGNQMREPSQSRRCSHFLMIPSTVSSCCDGKRDIDLTFWMVSICLSVHDKLLRDVWRLLRDFHGLLSSRFWDIWVRSDLKITLKISPYCSP